jgi:SIT4-associating protein SAP185/190
MGLLNERGSEEFIRERDAERERLREQGAFLFNKQSEGSAVDLSTTSSRFEHAFTPSESTSAEELRIANLGDEDGFEKVAVSDATDASLGPKEDMSDEPLSPRPEAQVPSQEPTTPTGNLDENVRRLSLDNPEDTVMTSPPNEPEPSIHSSPENVSGQVPVYPEDKPAPLFFKSSDPNKTPTANSPEPPLTPRATETRAEETAEGSPVQGEESFQNAENDIMQIVQSGVPSVDEAPVVGDYLKIMFVENRVVPTILVRLVPLFS